MKMRCTYLSDGTKVSALDAAGDGLLYRGNFVYEKNGQNVIIESIAWDEGRIRRKVYRALHYDEPVDVVDTLAVIDTLPGIPWHPKEPFIPTLLAGEGHWVEADTIELVLEPAIDRAPLYQDQWFVRGHLGNVRSVIDLTRSATMPADSVILEQNDYLPYGTKSSASSLSTDSAFRYRYAGKEEQRFGSFDSQLLDFGARYYDSYNCNWTTIDNLASQRLFASSYVYCGNDPINRFDPDGNAELFVRVIGGAAIGACTEATAAAMHGKSFQEIKGAAAKGLIEGAVIGVTLNPELGATAGAMATVLKDASLGAITGAVGSVVEQYISTGSIDGGDVCINAAAGSAAGIGAGAACRQVAKSLKTTYANIVSELKSSETYKQVEQVVKNGFKHAGISIGKSAKAEIQHEVKKEISNAVETAEQEYIFRSASEQVLIQDGVNMSTSIVTDYVVQ